MLERWRERDVFHESIRRREGSPPFIFYEGPPTANGRPGAHHVLARVFKDVFPRYRTMRGHFVPRKAGWDCHGLPVELEVEKELGFHNKHDIERFGIAEFNARCRESVLRYIDEWNELTERIGFWVDTDDAYFTLADDYIESVWWSLKQVWEKGLLVEGNRVVPYCTRCGTALSSHELSLGYEDVVDPSVYVKFPLVDEPDVSLLAWTTMPWTLVPHAAIAVDPDVRTRAPARTATRSSWRRRSWSACSARTPRSSRGCRGSELLGTALRAALPVHHRLRRARPHRAGGRLRLDRGRHRRGSHRRRLRRGRLQARHRERADDPQPGRCRGQVRRADRPVRGNARARGRPPHHRGAARIRPAVQRRGVRALLSPLLALRHAAHLLRQEELVRADHGGEGRAARGERDDQLAPRAHQARPLRQLAREQRRLGAVARALLGHAAAGVALRAGPRACASARWRRSREHGGEPPEDLHRPYIDEVVLTCERLRRRDAARAGPDRRLVGLGLHAVRPVARAVRDEEPSASASRRTTSARRSTRRAAGSTRCSPCRCCSSARRRTGPASASA